MRIFVTGATGYLDSAISAALKNAGHEVLGGARSEQARGRLQEAGVQPVDGSLTDLDVLRATAASADAVINAATSYEPDRGEIEQAAVEALLAGLGSNGKLLIYTSDQLIYGHTGDELADETRPLSPPPFLTWRPEIEKRVLGAGGVRGVVLRPAAVYGHGGNQLFPGLVARARQDGFAAYVAPGTARWSFVHVDDIADAYVAAVERAPVGTVANLAAQPPITLQEMGEAIARAAGVDDVRGLPVDQATDIFGPAAGLMASANLAISARRAEEVLGWTPSQPHVLDDLANGSYRLPATT